MKLKLLFLFFSTLIMFISCVGGGNSQSLAEGASGNMEAYENGYVNAIEQARPSIMIIPSDQTIQNFGALKETTIEGKKIIIRDYQKYLLADDRFPRIASFIQDAFNQQNYPLNDFAQTLKQLDNQSAIDLASGVRQDAKTMLFQTAQPDIILEMNYYKSSSLTSHDYKNKNVSYTLTALDAYSNKSIATVSANNLKGESTTEIIQQDLNAKLPDLMNDIQKYFSDILTRGREVTIRILVDGDSNVNLQDQNFEGDTYSDWLLDYVKSKSVKGACKLQRNTNNELYFVNVRIPLLQKDGTQYGVYDFTRDLQKTLRNNLGLKSTNNAQGLGEIILLVKGI